MLYSVAQINAVVYNKSKGAFRRPTVRRAQRYEDHKGEGRKVKSVKNVFLILVTLFVLTLSFCNKEKKLPDNPIIYEPNEFVIEGTVLIKYIGSSTDVIIPDGVTSIGKEAFREKQLKSVIIPDGITSIADNAFRSNQLISITIPESVTFIGEEAFAWNNLISLTIPNGVTTIGKGAFKGNKLTDFTIPNNVTSIGEEAFMDNKLAGITIPNNVNFIGKDAFLKNNI